MKVTEALKQTMQDKQL